MNPIRRTTIPIRRMIRPITVRTVSRTTAKTAARTIPRTATRRALTRLQIVSTAQAFPSWWLRMPSLRIRIAPTIPKIPRMRTIRTACTIPTRSRASGRDTSEESILTTVTRRMYPTQLQATTMRRVTTQSRYWY